MLLLPSNIQVQVVLQEKTVCFSTDTNGEVEECAVKHQLIWLVLCSVEVYQTE
jgi:hypothetical protein